MVVAGRQSLPIERQIWERSPIVIAPDRSVSPPVRSWSSEEEEWPDPVESAAGIVGSWAARCPPRKEAHSWRGRGGGGHRRGRDLCRVAGRRGTRHGPDRGDFATMAQSSAVNIKDVRMVGPDIRIDVGVEPP